MADGTHTHGNKHLTLDDVQTIIGRAMVDERFRAEFTSAPEATLQKLHISMDSNSADNTKAVELITNLADALKDENSGTSMKDAIQKMRDCYLASSDGIVRPRCG